MPTSPNSLRRNISSESVATSGPVKRSPKQITLASLCSRASRAEVTSCTTAARTPAILFAAMAMPIPVPHTQTPKSAPPDTTLAPDGGTEVRVVHRLGREGAEVRHFVTQKGEALGEVLFQIQAGVVGSRPRRAFTGVYRPGPQASERPCLLAANAPELCSAARLCTPPGSAPRHLVQGGTCSSFAISPRRRGAVHETATKARDRLA